MKPYIEERTMQVARHVADTKDTIRETAKVFNLSKSTVHYDLSTRLQKVDGNLYGIVKKILDKNFAEKHIRGGEATKKKYEKEIVK